MEPLTLSIFISNLIFAGIGTTMFVFNKKHDSYYGVFACLHLLIAILISG